jgi:putative membrane protein
MSQFPGGTQLAAVPFTGWPSLASLGSCVMHSKIVVVAIALTSMACMGLPASAKENPGQKFLTKAIQGNLAEVAMGQLAEQQGGSADIKAFGQALQKDHSDANAKAMAAATAMGVTSPTAPTKKQEADHDKLAKLSGEKFDREFAKHMVMDHKKDIAEYTKASKMKAGDQAASYAADTLPTLQSHLDTAQALAKHGKAGM